MTTNLSELAQKFYKEKFRHLTEEISFDEYLERIHDNPRIIRTAYQRMYDMILAPGVAKIEKYDQTFNHYNFFDDDEIPIFGLEETLDKFVRHIRGAACGYGTERRILLLHGPVGSSKSTICRLLKRGLENYSRTDEGAWYTYKWVDLPTADGIAITEEDECPMHNEPIKLLSPEMLNPLLGELNEILMGRTPKEDLNSLYKLKVTGTLNPRCKKYLSELLHKYDGDLEKVIQNHVRVIRKVHSEADRVGIATFQPKDEKNQDATELTGDIAWNKLTHFGSDSDPRAFNFDGELCVSERGCCEFIEIYKLQREFLYDLLGATQEQQIKPKKFSQIGIDTVLIGHTNNPEYERLQQDKYMEALKDRTVKIDVPYLLEWSKEIRIYKHEYGPEKVRQHVAPHTIEMAALWAVITRLIEHEDVDDLVKKAKLYDGKVLPGWSEDKIREIREKLDKEGMGGGISPRYIQDKLSQCLSDKHDYINPFMLLTEIENGLRHSALLSDDKDKLKRCLDCVDAVKKEFDEILKTEVRKCLVADETAIVRLCTNYVDNLLADIHGSKIKNPYTGREEEPNEALMRSIEEKIQIPETGVEDFRQMIAGSMAKLGNEGKKFEWNSNPELKKALEAKLFEDTKDHIKLGALNAGGVGAVDPDLQEKIDIIKKRLIEKHGYNEQSAADVLNHVSSIFARGDLAKDE
jgi:serine protein kinase